jgi:uncharacterized DUF497 family protein
MFVWDSANIAHIARHKVEPEEAEQVIQNSPLDMERQLRSGEERVVHLGETKAGRILVVVAVANEDDIRVVTAYPADRRLRKFYLSQKVMDDGEAPENP